MKDKKIILNALLFLIVLVLSGCIVYNEFFSKPKLNNMPSDQTQMENSPQTSVEEPINRDNESDYNKDELVTLESIKKLAQNPNLKIETNYATTFDLYGIGMVLQIRNGILYVNYNNKSYVVKDVDEKFVGIVDAERDCYLEEMAVLFLTENGNLYSLRPGVSLVVGDDAHYRDEISYYLNNFDFIHLGLIRINGDEKVLAFSTLKGDGRGKNCGGSTKVVYTSDNKYKLVGDYNINSLHDGHIATIGGSYNYGFRIYENKTISITGNEIIKNNNNQDLIFKKIFSFSWNEKLNTDFIVVDENNNLYVSTGRDNRVDKVKLYSNEKFKDYSVKWDNTEISEVNIELNDGNSIVIKRDGFIHIY